MEEKRNKSRFWNFVNEFEGDKVTWMIVLILIMLSILAISSSTPLLALMEKNSRADIIREQMIVASLGLGVIIVLYNIKSIWIFRFFSQLGFFVSVILLLILTFKISLGVIRPIEVNKAVRIISIFKFQVHVFEVVKLAMIMYLAWAMDAYNKDNFTMIKVLSKSFPFLNKDIWKKIIYIYSPIVITCGLVLHGSNSSALFIGMISLVTILVGGVKINEMVKLGAILGVGLTLLIGLHFASGGKFIPRIGTAISRIQRNPEKELKESIGTKEFQDALNDNIQPISAKVAVSEGGLIGKGPGNSTQRYIVPIMFEDYMFAFIIEEYGLLGAIFVMMLYGSLLARGSMIVRNCSGVFAKTAVAGIVILISGQAMLHMLVNVDLGPLTGQTLPILSHGTSSFLMFSAAFGIILSISRMAKRKIEKETMQARPIIETTDEIKESLNDLDEMEELN